MRLPADIQVVSLAPRFGMNVVRAGDVLIDAATSNSTPKIERAIAAHTIKAIALTHAHPDHAGGAAALRHRLNTEVWCPAAEAPSLEAGDIAPLAPRSIIYRWQCARWMSGPCDVARHLREGDEIGSGFVAIDTPGHSPGHTCFWRDSDATLVLGDLAWNMHPLTGQPGLREPPRIFTLDPTENRRSLRKAAALMPHTIVFAHGRPLTDAAEPFSRFVKSLPTNA